MATATKAKKAAIGIRAVARTILYVKDWAENVRFYKETLGLKPAYPIVDGWAEFSVGGNALCLHGGRTSKAKATGVCCVSFHVKDLDGAIEGLGAAGVKVSKPFSPCEGLRCASFEDPSGNQLSLEGS